MYVDEVLTMDVIYFYVFKQFLADIVILKSGFYRTQVFDLLAFKQVNL